MSSATFQQISPAGGAEVVGLDLSDAASVLRSPFLRDACIEHAFLLLRNQKISLEDQYRFGSLFGEVIEGFNTAAEGSFVTSKGDLCLHFDHWMRDGYPKPIHFTMLYGIKVTPDGGQTIFANMRNVYRSLPESLKERIEGKRGVHCYNYSGNARLLTDVRVRASDLPPGQPEAIHPLVRPHPDTQEKILYISPRNTDRIIGLQPDESEALLSEIWPRIYDAQQQYHHTWKPGDMLIWDNHTVLHGRTDFDPSYERKLRRLCIF